MSEGDLLLPYCLIVDPKVTRVLNYKKVKS